MRRHRTRAWRTVEYDDSKHAQVRGVCRVWRCSVPFQLTGIPADGAIVNLTVLKVGADDLSQVVARTIWRLRPTRMRWW